MTVNYGPYGSSLRDLPRLRSTHRRRRGLPRQSSAPVFQVQDVAQLSGMSVSAFYRNFQAVTAMSPIQFQKQIRLQEARLLLATHPHDITGVSHRVGYDSPSQFSREYRRQFGAPPSQDALRLRDLAPGPAPALV